MDVTSIPPFTAAGRAWPWGGGWMLTVVCKATFRLAPGESVVHSEAEPPVEDDVHWDNNPSRSLAAASDMVPFKRRPEVILVGSAFAPGKALARSIIARLLVGEVDKAIECFGERAWDQDGNLREGPRIVKAPLRYERAAGGPDSWNPVGVRPDALPDLYGKVPLPALQPAGSYVGRREDVVLPIGFGPIAASWPERREKLGRLAGHWPRGRWSDAPMPEGIDPGFFNAAPRDQLLAELRADERIVLEGLHPEHGRLVTNLPGLRPRATVERPGRAPEDVTLACDTLWIDTDRGLAALVWRGQLALAHPAEPGRVVVSTLGAAAPAWAPPPPPQPQTAPRAAPEELPAELEDTYAGDDLVAEDGDTATGEPAGLGAALPFGQGAREIVDEQTLDDGPPWAREPQRMRRPADASLEQCAAITAQVARRPEQAAQILAAHGLGEEQWAEIAGRWAEALREEARRGGTALLTAYDAAFVAQLEAERGPIRPDEYAYLAVSAERGAAAAALQHLGLPRGAQARIDRVYLARMGADPALAAWVHAAVAAARRA
ncbi:MAG: DUF2169 domain-containing protein [Polyangiaceae bacterium]|nr:DUF2169 domain-containing protein [Polyangiaceae bacterium]